MLCKLLLEYSKFKCAYYNFLEFFSKILFIFDWFYLRMVVPVDMEGEYIRRN